MLLFARSFFVTKFGQIHFVVENQSAVATEHHIGESLDLIQSQYLNNSEVQITFSGSHLDAFPFNGLSQIIPLSVRFLAVHNAAHPWIYGVLLRKDKS